MHSIALDNIAEEGFDIIHTMNPQNKGPKSHRSDPIHSYIHNHKSIRIELENKKKQRKSGANCSMEVVSVEAVGQENEASEFLFRSSVRPASSSPLLSAPVAAEVL
mgnify:CR=1 FL=1